MGELCHMTRDAKYNTKAHLHQSNLQITDSNTLQRSQLQGPCASSGVQAVDGGTGAEGGEATAGLGDTCIRWICQPPGCYPWCGFQGHLSGSRAMHIACTRLVRLYVVTHGRACMPPIRTPPVHSIGSQQHCLVIVSVSIKL